MSEISELLERTGLTKGESKVYLALLKLNMSKVGNIVKKSGVSASKVYDILDRLIQKTLVSYVIKEEIRVYIARDPKQLLEFLDEQEKKIEENKKAIQSILPQLIETKGSSSSKPVVQIMEGRKGFMSAQDQFVKEQKLGSKYYAMTGKKITREFAAWFKEYNFRKMDKNITTHLIYTRDAWESPKQKIEERKKRTYFYPKICPIDALIPIYLAISEDKCLITLFTDKIVNIIIRNKDMVEGFKKYLQYIWDLSETPKGFKKLNKPLF